MSSVAQHGKFPLFIKAAFIPNTPISLKDVLIRQSLNFCDINSTQDEVDIAFTWILDHQHDVTIAIDGLDELGFEIKDGIASKNELIDVDKKYEPSYLLNFILSKKVLPNTHLVSTSRPHSTIENHKNVKPNTMALIGELSKTNVEKLIHFYIDNTYTANILLNSIFSKYPKIKSPIFSPVFLKIVCSLCNGEEKVHNIVNSVSTFFEVLTKRYGSTSHNASEFDVNENSILRELSSLAYRKTMVEETFQILPGDLSKLNLTQNEVQDFITVSKYTGDRSSLVHRFTSQSFQVSFNGFKVEKKK